MIGTVLESLPPRRLAFTFDAPGAVPSGGPSKVTFDIEPYHEIVRLTVTHENLVEEGALQAISAGWPAVCANLKSLLETGHVLSRPRGRCTPICAPPRWRGTIPPLRHRDHSGSVCRSAIRRRGGCYSLA